MFSGDLGASGRRPKTLRSVPKRDLIPPTRTVVFPEAPFVNTFLFVAVLACLTVDAQTDFGRFPDPVKVQFDPDGMHATLLERIRYFDSDGVEWTANSRSIHISFMIA